MPGGRASTLHADPAARRSRCPRIRVQRARGHRRDSARQDTCAAIVRTCRGGCRLRRCGETPQPDQAWPHLIRRHLCPSAAHVGSARSTLRSKRRSTAASERAPNSLSGISAAVARTRRKPACRDANLIRRKFSNQPAEKGHFSKAPSAATGQDHRPVRPSPPWGCAGPAGGYRRHGRVGNRPASTDAVSPRQTNAPPET